MEILDLESTIKLLERLTPSNQQLIRELIIKLLPKDPTGTYTVDFDPQAVVPQWIDRLTFERKSRLTIKNYSFHLKHLLADFPQPTSAQIDAYFVQCHARGLGVSSINIMVSSFRSFFSFCVEKDHIANSPASHLKRLKRSVRERKSPAFADILKILSLDLSLRDRALMYLFIDSGLRLDEIRHILLADIGNHEVTVIGKGDKQRTVPLTDSAILALWAYIAELPNRGKYLFPGRFPGQAASWRSIEKYIDRLCTAAGVERFTPHQLRHYFATQMLNSGANLKVVSEFLGHSTPAVTATVYWHVDSGMKKREHDLYSPLANLVERNVD